METAIGIAALVVLANVLGMAASKARLPDLLGAILAGVVLGPSVTGFIGRQSEEGGAMQSALLSSTLDALAFAGLVSLMVSAGLSINKASNIRSGPLVPAIAVGCLFCLLPALASAPFVAAMVPDSQIATDPGSIAAYHFILAMAAIVTSVPFLTKIFINTGLIESQFARQMLEIACFLDLVLWSLFPVAQALKTNETQDVLTLLVPLFLTVLFLTSFLLSAKYGSALIRTSLNQRSDVLRDVTMVATLGILATVFSTVFGVHTMIGSFIFGYCLQIYAGGVASLRPIFTLVASRILIPVYFAVVGLSIDIQRDVDLGLILLFLVWSSLIKMAGVFPVTLFLRRNLQVAATYAVVLNTRGGPGIALASLGLSTGLIGEPTFIALIFASIATAITAEAWLNRVKADILDTEYCQVNAIRPQGSGPV